MTECKTSRPYSLHTGGDLAHIIKFSSELTRAIRMYT